MANETIPVAFAAHYVACALEIVRRNGLTFASEPAALAWLKANHSSVESEMFASARRVVDAHEVYPAGAARAILAR